MDRRSFYTFISFIALTALVGFFIFLFNRPEDQTVNNAALNAAQDANRAAMDANMAAERAADRASEASSASMMPPQTIVDHRREVVRVKEVQVPAPAKPESAPKKEAAEPIDVESTSGESQ